MAAVIRDLTSDELSLFGRIVAKLTCAAESGVETRNSVFRDMIRLLRADFGASYVWNEERRRYESCVYHNIDPSNLDRYERWFQYRDPMTNLLRQRRRATLVEEVIPRSAMIRTEFYNDFLARDGLHHGVNMFVFDDGRDLGDFRIWRSRAQPQFTGREVSLLDTLEPFLRRALKNDQQALNGLTPRENEVAALVARGCTDRDIARVLRIGFGTVRTHLTRAMAKRGCANRAELAALVVRENGGRAS